MKLTWNRVSETLELEVQMHDKIQPLRMLGEYLGLIGSKAGQNSRPVESIVREMVEDEGRSLTPENMKQIRQVAWGE